MFAGEPKLNAFEAYWWIFNHPKSVSVHPDHPLIDLREYEPPEAFKYLLELKEYKPRDNTYYTALREHATTSEWEGQFIYNLDFVYEETEATGFTIFLETGPAYFDDMVGQYMSNSHDINLDTSADTFEEALIKLADKIKAYYGDYEDEYYVSVE